jgi:hypothetical protein
MPAALDGITRRVRKPRAEPGLLRSAWPISPPLSFIAEMRSHLHEEDHGEAGAGV